MIESIRRSISRKFMLAMLATTILALLMACIGLLIYDVRTYQTISVHDLTTQADILAKISLPALEFNDPKAAQENLQQLKVRPNILAAAIYTPHGALFAHYVNSDLSSFNFPHTLKLNAHTIDGNEIDLFRAITRNNEIVGIMYLHARFPITERILSYLSILAAVMLTSLIVALLVATWLQAAVTRPILAVTDAVNHVIRRRDFSARVIKSTEDEVGVLADAFNTMLVEVGERTTALEDSNRALQREMQERLSAEEALRQLNDTLEQRIAARTAELERVHEQLRQSQKMEAIGQLTGGIAHDFNNVLQIIVSNLQLLQMRLTDNTPAQQRLQAAAYATERGAKLSSQLLAFARRQPLQPVPTNLGKILRGMGELLRRALGEAIEIETVVSGGLWNTHVDPNQLENVILNLAINARDAMKQGGKLTLELGNATLDDHYVAKELDVPAGQYVMLAISDTGTGMPAEVMARAFEPFFTTKREGEGTGLGLAMTYGFVKQSHGHIKIYSEVGSGTTVKIYLPRSFETEIELISASVQPVMGGSETILVVEDDADVQAAAVDMLTNLGYQVLKAHDGESALAVLNSSSHIDMLFTDVVMPGPVRSPEVAKQAKQRFPHIAVLFTSGYTQNAIVHGGRLDPGVELVSKPYRREDLARKIRSLLPSKPASQLSAEPVNVIDAAHAIRVLVVEDNVDAQHILCELLMLLGHQVVGANSAEAALLVLEKEHFDVLLTDITLPGMSGIELARQALVSSPSLKIILSSGYGDMAATGVGFKAASLPKPYDLKKLQKVLAEI
jgi:signal transduction histidine kinase/DNA-binding response OmpR family regulator